MTEARWLKKLTDRWGSAQTLAVGLIAVLGVIIWWQVVGTWHPTPVIFVSPTSDELLYNVGIGCYRDGGIRASVSEDDDAVLVTVDINGEVDNGLMCARLVPITLKVPLGDRQMFDGATGDSVPTR